MPSKLEYITYNVIPLVPGALLPFIMPGAIIHNLLQHQCNVTARLLGEKLQNCLNRYGYTAIFHFFLFYKYTVIHPLQTSKQFLAQMTLLCCSALKPDATNFK